MYQTIVQAVLAHGEETPDKLAVGFLKTRITYAQLCRRMKYLAAKLAKDYGVCEGDMVMIQGVSKPDFIVAWLAAQYLKAVTVPADKTAKEENLLDVYRYTQPRLLLTDAPVSAEDVKCVSLDQLCREAEQTCGETPEAGQQVCGTAADDTAEKTHETAATQKDDYAMDLPPYTLPEKSAVAEILFTTGTTGKPKGTMLTFGNICAITNNMIQGVGMAEDECLLVPLPLNHSLGIRSMRAALYRGASLIIQEGFAFAKVIDDNIKEFQCTAMVIVPASMELIYRQMRRHFPRIMGQLRYIEVGAGSLGYDMKKKLLAELPNTRVINTWGSTETGGVIFLKLSEHPEKLTALGYPIETAKVRIVDSEGNDISATARDIDTAGRLTMQGEMQMAGYYKMPEATAQTLVDGWLYTNDVAYLDDDGFVYMMGRADDIINVGGEKVSPIEVENIAQEFEEIRECACIGGADPVLGQVPVLFVVPEGKEFHQDQFGRFMAERVEKFKLPQRFVMIDALPRNRMQKLDRKALHRMWEEQK
jgi:long-chain acyl-CoA synthetase